MSNRPMPSPRLAARRYPPDLLHALASGIDGQGGWRDRALCAETGPELFFPEKGQSTEPAKRICRACEVRAECLQDALDRHEPFGIWGGLSERERRRLRRQPAA